MNSFPSRQHLSSNCAWLAIVVATVFSTSSFAQVFSGYVSTDGEIVVVGTIVFRGLSLESSANNLEPIPPGDFTADPSPFQFLAANNQSRVVWGNISSSTILRGSFDTGVRLGDGDVSKLIGWHSAEDAFTIFDAPPPEVSATFDVGGRLMIHGTAPELTRVIVESTAAAPVSGRPFGFGWFSDLEGLDGSLSLPYQSDIYPVSDDFNLVAIYCQEDGNCREIEFETEFVCEPSFGDVNGDGRVGFADFLIMSFNFGKEVPNHRYGDNDCNGSVEFADFLVTSRCFGCTTVGANAVPEPRSNVMMVLAIVLCMSRLRSKRRR